MTRALQFILIIFAFIAVFNILSVLGQPKFTGNPVHGPHQSLP